MWGWGWGVCVWEEEEGGQGTVVGLTGRVGGLADMKRLAPPADEVLPLGSATEPGRPAHKEVAIVAIDAYRQDHTKVA